MLTGCLQEKHRAHKPSQPNPCIYKSCSIRQFIPCSTCISGTHTVVLCLILCEQVAAGNIDRDAGGGSDSQEVTALKYKAVESQVSILKRRTPVQGLLALDACCDRGTYTMGVRIPGTRYILIARFV